MKSYLSAALVIFATFSSTFTLAANKNTTPNKVLLGAITVAAVNDEWTQTSVKISEGDLLFVAVRDGEKVVVGSSLGAVDANGFDNGIGSLQIKVGSGAAKKIGTNGSLLATESGNLKFKIYDTRYEDNSGVFNIFVIHVPATIIPTKPQQISVQ